MHSGKAGQSAIDRGRSHVLQEEHVQGQVVLVLQKQSHVVQMPGGCLDVAREYREVAPQPLAPGHAGILQSGGRHRSSYRSDTRRALADVAHGLICFSFELVESFVMFLPTIVCDILIFEIFCIPVCV